MTEQETPPAGAIKPRRRVITTFYSFKGGVGRSMALQAVAHRLAEHRRRVLMVDADMEAPGLSVAVLPHDEVRGCEKIGLCEEKKGHRNTAGLGR